MSAFAHCVLRLFTTHLDASWFRPPGAPHDAIASVINEPVSGFQAIMGARDLWGKGIYFARDAAYPFYGTGTARFCYEEGGVYKIMLCLVGW